MAPRGVRRECVACVIRAMPKSMIFTAAVGQQHDVRRLDVAVNDSGRVRVPRPAAICDMMLHLMEHGRRLPAVDDALQVLPVQQLHDDERHAVLLAEIVDGNDVRVAEAARCGGFSRGSG